MQKPPVGGVEGGAGYFLILVCISFEEEKKLYKGWGVTAAFAKGNKFVCIVKYFLVWVVK